MPAEDEELTRRYRTAGLVIFGKTNTPELGVSNVTEPELFGPTRNPWNLERTSSGSSGGSAAAVAARIVPAANANDGGGSIRTPASNCGLVGLEAESRPQPDRAPCARRLVGLHRRARGDAHRARQRGAARRHRGRLSAAAHEAAGAGASVSRGDAAASRAGCASPSRSIRASGKTLHPENREALEATTARAGGARARTRRGQAAAAAGIVRRKLRVADRGGRRGARCDWRRSWWGARRAATTSSSPPGCWRRWARRSRAAEVAAALWTMQTFSRQWLAWSAGFDVLLTPTVGVPPLPIGAHKLPTMQRQGAEAADGAARLPRC